MNGVVQGLFLCSFGICKREIVICSRVKKILRKNLNVFRHKRFHTQKKIVYGLLTLKARQLAHQ